ncbi:MAG TPA: DUF6600 domain-containing protein [Candidatus Acidoferrales bacterium]|nr:DUF6600 domain-containing protein [Candidatus Acidoferrales bacterium]
MRKATLVSFLGLLSGVMLLALLAPSRAAADDDDPPSRVARLSQLQGSVSFNPAGTDDWVDAVLNRPLTTGDKLWADKDGRAELHLGTASIRLSHDTGMSFLNLDDNTTQIQLTDGSLRIRVKRLDDNETFEIDTPNLAFSILRPGTYRVDVNESGDATIVQVRSGEGEVTGGGSAYTIHPNEVGTFSGSDQLSADVQGFDGQNDDFDNWCNQRDSREDRATSGRYVSDDVVGYEDLDDYGGWRAVPEYGSVWFPHVTVVGWAPYRYGHWVWISPWGWTWVEDEPWGYAPFHYGRWVVVGGVWGWVPCAPRAVVGVAYVRPVYAPALVAWVGGPHFAVGVGVGGVGGGVSVGWFPLGPREVFVPSYRVSRTYVTNVNVSNTRVETTVVNNYYNNVIVNKQVNVTNVTYVNRTYVTAVSGETFTSARPVSRNLVRVDSRTVTTVAATTPGFAPQQRSVVGIGAQARFRPPAAVETRAVVAKRTPPPRPVSFASQREQIAANGGRPVPQSQMRSAGVRTAEAQPNVRIAPPARTVIPSNGQMNRPTQDDNAHRGNRPPMQTNQPPAQNDNRQMNSNRPSQPANPPNRDRNFNDRPPSSRPANNGNNNTNPQFEQRQQQQLDQLHQKQDQERQKVEQQQIRDQQKLQQQQADAQRQQSLQQKQQQRLEQMERKHDEQQQKLEQKQQQERSRQEGKQEKPRQERSQDKPPKQQSQDRPKDNSKPHNR